MPLAHHLLFPLAFLLLVSANSPLHASNNNNNNNDDDNNRALATTSACTTLQYALPDLTFTGPGKPYFSWAHVPVFWHAGSTSFMTDDEVQFVAQHPFGTVTIEKWEGVGVAPVGEHAEDRMAATARRIKAVNPNAQVVFYLHTAGAYPNYDFYCELAAKGLILKSKGRPDIQRSRKLGNYPEKPCFNGSVVSNARTRQSRGPYVIDWAKPGAIQAWSEELARIRGMTWKPTNGPSKPLFSGLFLDRTKYGGISEATRRGSWQRAHINAIAFVRLPSNGWSNDVLISDDTQDDFNGKKYASLMQLFMYKNPVSSMLSEVLLLQRMGRDGRVVNVHANGCGPDDDPTREAGLVRRITLSGFLVGACRGSYYACNRFFSVQPIGDKLPTNMFCWYGEFNRPLGAPLGAAKQVSVRKQTHFYRAFQGGAEVFLTIHSRATKTDASSCVCWNGSGDVSNQWCTPKDSCAKMAARFAAVYKGPQEWQDDGCA